MQKGIYRLFVAISVVVGAGVSAVSASGTRSAIGGIAGSAAAQVSQRSVSVQGERCRLHGTLLSPAGDSARAVVLIVAGSGPTDRNGNQEMVRNNSLKMLAMELARHNVASLRYDKRGVGESRCLEAGYGPVAGGLGGDGGALVVEDYIADVKLWVQELRRMRRYDKVVVLGHSEGSLVGMAAINDGAQADGFVSVAGAGRTFDVIIKEQMELQPAQVRDIANEIVDSLRHGVVVGNVPVFLSPLFSPAVQPFIISIMRYSPQCEMRKLKVPSLLVQGDRDIQIKVLDARLLNAVGRSSELVVIQGMNHVLKCCESDDRELQMVTYVNPALPINESAVHQIIKFINSRVL